ncbi:hypothetical protein M8818_004555 [Zalaria obscura]|uniref:Uncharacterized protein n=1 Tax=Zalaria obscura TaxID=2024903 RepID=A0ACC3SD80_9PEZI
MRLASVSSELALQRPLSKGTWKHEIARSICTTAKVASSHDKGTHLMTTLNAYSPGIPVDAVHIDIVHNPVNGNSSREMQLDPISSYYCTLTFQTFFPSSVPRDGRSH